MSLLVTSVSLHCNSDTIESRGGIGPGSGMTIATVQHRERISLISWQRPIVGRVFVGMLRALLWNRKSPKGCLLAGLYCRESEGKTDKEDLAHCLHKLFHLLIEHRTLMGIAGENL